MEGIVAPQTPQPSRNFNVGDLVHVYNGTSAGTRGYKTIAYMGTVVGYDVHGHLSLTLLICVRCNGFGISPFQSERRLNLRTVSAKTKARLIQEVDARNGWELQQKKDEVKRV